MKLELTNPKAWKKISERNLPMESKLKVYEKVGGAYRLGRSDGEQVYNKLSELIKDVVSETTSYKKTNKTVSYKTMTASEAKSPQKRIENTLKPTTTKVDYDVEVPVSEKAGVANRLGKNYAVNKKKNKISELLRPGIQVSVTGNGKDLGKWSVKNSTNNQADLMSQDGNKELNLKVMDNEYVDMDGNKYDLSQIGENNIYESDDHEVSMAMNLLDDIIKNANELKGKIGTTEIDLPGWVQDHISQSQNFINQANTGYNDTTNKGQLKSK